MTIQSDLFALFLLTGLLAVSGVHAYGKVNSEEEEPAAPGYVPDDSSFSIYFMTVVFRAYRS